jgi:hypothetical protein
MIFDKFVEFLFGNMTSLFMSAPPLEVPENYQDLMELYRNSTSNISQMGAWVNFMAVQNALILIISSYTLAFVIKVVRQAISLGSGGGGATN